MIYLDVCSGISAPTVAWKPMGWQCFGYSEVAKFPSAVLKYHYPDTPNYGDMTQFKRWPRGAVDVLIGGTPCQAFSIAGLRAGMDDPRGELTLTYLAIAKRYRPRWLVWENVPGVLSQDEGGALRAFLSGLAELGYGWAYRTLDAQYFDLAQRRSRVLVVAHLGDWRRAAAVLFEPESLRWDSPPRRQARERVAGSLEARTGGGGESADGYTKLLAGDIAGTVTANSSNGRSNGSRPIPDNLVAFGGNNTQGEIEVATAVRAHDSFHQDFETETLLVAKALRASDGGIDREDAHTLVTLYDNQQITRPGRRGTPKPGDPSPTLAGDRSPLLAFDSKASGSRGMAVDEDLSPTLRAMNAGPGGRQNAGGQVAVAISLRGRDGGATAEIGGEVSHALRASQGGGDKPHVLNSMRVRRLTPEECEILQGFPRGYTLIPFPKKPVKDSPRYKAIGNAMPVPVIRWIGERIALCDTIERRTA